MSYQIRSGLSAEDLVGWLKRAKKHFGCFDDGRVNYTEADTAPTVMCTVVFRNRLLLVKRGFELADAEGYWSTVDGFIDEIKPVKDQVKQEVQEELGIIVKDNNISVGPSYTLISPELKRRYIVFPCLVVLLTEPKIVLNEENTKFAWILRKDLEKYHMLEDLPYAIDSALKLQDSLLND